MRLIKPLVYNRKIGTDFVSIDIGSKSSKFVRIRKSRAGLSLSDMDIHEYEGNGLDLAAMKKPVPDRFKAPQCVLTVSDPSVAIRLLSIPANAFNQGAVARRISDQLGLGSDYRYSYKVLKEAEGKEDAEVLVAAISDAVALNALQSFPSGQPAPVYLECSHLSALKTFTASASAECADSAVAFVEGGSESIFLSVFAKNRLMLARTFPVGAEKLFADIERRFGLGTTQARAVMSVSNFDVSESISSVLGRFIDQLNLSRDYIERRDGVRLSNVYMSGGLSLSPYVLAAVSKACGVPVKEFKPFEVDGVALGGSISAEVKGYESRFTAAIGAALNTMGES